MVKAQPASDGRNGGAPALSVYEVLRRLRGVRKSGDGWIALCPTHADARPSLSVGTGRDGRLLLNCHANKGCDYHGILTALGFDRSDSATFVSSSTATLAARVLTPKKSDAPPSNLSPDNSLPEKGAKDSSPSVRQRADAEAVCFYDYRDASGALRYQVMRFADPKDFRPRYYDEEAKVWKRGLPTGGRVLYRLPELLAARERDATEPIFVCEGEKDADALIERGLVATTNAGGAKSWRDEYAESLRGAHVCIVVDHDRAGVERGETVARSVASVAASVKVLDLFVGEPLPEKHGKDVSDFLTASGTASDLVRLWRDAPAWTPGESETEKLQSAQMEAAPVLSFPELAPLALYGLAGEIVRLIAPHSEADEAALLVQTLAAFGNCVGRSAHFVAEDDRHYLNLFVVLVGATSKGRKGTSWGRVRRFFHATDELWAMNCIHGGLSSGEGLIWAVRDPVEKQEPIKDKGRITGYQTNIVDTGVEDKRALVMEAEYASVLRVMTREGNTLSAIIRQAWDTGDLRVMTRNAPARATNAHVSIIGHITKDELRRNLEETETASLTVFCGSPRGDQSCCRKAES